MPQLSLYIDDATMETLRSSAKAEDVSMSRYAADLIRNRAQLGTWPNGYWDSIYGCLNDATFSVDDDSSINASFPAGNPTLDAALDDACDWFE